jgi:hypothetical protein
MATWLLGITYVLCLICTALLIYAIGITKSLGEILLWSGGLVFFLSLFFFIFNSVFESKKLPEYRIKEAEEILKAHADPSESNSFMRLKELIQQAKQTKKTDKLEQWLKDFKEFNSMRDLEQEFSSLIRKFEEMHQKILKNAETRAFLKINLFY